MTMGRMLMRPAARQHDEAGGGGLSQFSTLVREPASFLLHKYCTFPNPKPQTPSVGVALGDGERNSYGPDQVLMVGG
jgi:hypothetical protein